jgi:hypothetical protein
MMPAPGRDKWSELREGAKLKSESAQIALKEWSEAVRAEPSLLWQTLTIRYTVYAVGALTLILTLRCAVNAVQPPLPKGATPRATTAHFDVICSDEACQKHFIIERAFAFDDFPVPCPACGKDSGYQALRCVSQTCRGRLTQTYTRDDGLRYCVRCNGPLER